MKKAQKGYVQISIADLFGGYETLTSTAPLVVDGFAGGGGASTGMEMALGRPVSIAINHDESAILMHQMNHPATHHYKDDIWMVDPRIVTGGRPVGLAWFSPDCKHFSRAKGAALVDRHIRGLAWVVVKWAALARPAVIMMENVPEFITWGPVRKGHPVKKKAGQTFKKWISQLEDLGYKIEYRELCAADYGAPTIRTRFCLIARCDGRPIVWPKPTHAPRNSEDVKSGKLKPWRSAAEIIDWSLPTYSIFASKEELKKKYGITAVRPLAGNTQARIAKGLDKFVINSAEPFVMCNNAENNPHSVGDPVPTVTTGNRNYLCVPTFSPFEVECNHSGAGHLRGVMEPLSAITTRCTSGVVTPFLAQYHTETAKGECRGQSLQDPIMTVDASNRYGLVTPYLSEWYGNGCDGISVKDPVRTITSKDREALTVASITKFYGGVIGSAAHNPLPTVTSIDHNALTVVHIDKYFAGGYSGGGNSPFDPLTTITAEPRHSLYVSHLAHFKGQDKGQHPADPMLTVTSADGQFALIKTVVVRYEGQPDLGYWPKVREMLNRYTDWCIRDDELLLIYIGSGWYYISDVGLRMLTPRELYNAMGFPKTYIIAVDHMGRPISRKDQVARCGNSVCPPLAEALVRANLPEYCRKAS